MNDRKACNIFLDIYMPFYYFFRYNYIVDIVINRHTVLFFIYKVHTAFANIPNIKMGLQKLNLQSRVIIGRNLNVRIFCRKIALDVFYLCNVMVVAEKQPMTCPHTLYHFAS